MASIWNDSGKADRLRYLWMKRPDLTIVQIAVDLGLGLTGKNAVIGKANRLGLPHRRSIFSHSQKTQAKKVATVATAVIIEEMQPDVITKLVPCANVTLAQLTATMCRWPSGDPQSPAFRFCGYQAVPGRPYCARHVSIAYTPVRPRLLLRKKRLEVSEVAG